jgi:hypothetical protein
MECPQCRSSNPNDKEFCGDCGTKLSSQPLISEAGLRARIRAAIREELTDQKVAEVEITESVIAKILNWVKLLAYIAGIPLALLVLVLGWLGLRKYNDLWSLARAAENKIKPAVVNAEKKARELTERNQHLTEQGDAVEKRLGQLGPKLAAIEANVAGVESKFNKKLEGIQIQVSEISELVKPGYVRWPVKTGSDGDAHLVSQKPIHTTIEALVGLEAPKNLSSLQDHRARPVELTIYTVEATIDRYRHQHDGDFELVIRGGSGATMHAEVPDPDPAFVPSSSPWALQIAQARKAVQEKLHPEIKFRSSAVRARITGVGFFDRLHHQFGMAPNGMELHPVIRIEYLP